MNRRKRAWVLWVDLLATVALLVLWSASVMRRMTISLHRAGAQIYALEASLGTIEFQHWNVPTPPRWSPRTPPPTRRAGDGPVVFRITPNRVGSPNWWENFGLRLPDGGSETPFGGGSVGRISIPIWIALLPFAPTAVLGLFRVRRKLRPGDCSQCGYNLTGNLSGVCPECGTPRAQTAGLPPAESRAPSV